MKILRHLDYGTAISSANYSVISLYFICMCVYIYIYICIHTHTHTHIHTNTPAHTHIQTDKHMNKHIISCIELQKTSSSNVYKEDCFTQLTGSIIACMYTHTHTHTCTVTHTHTHTHTLKLTHHKLYSIYKNTITQKFNHLSLIHCLQCSSSVPLQGLSLPLYGHIYEPCGDAIFLYNSMWCTATAGRGQ